MAAPVYPNSLCFSLIIQWQRYRRLGSVHPDKFLIRIRSMLSNGQFDEVQSICQSGGSRGLPQIVLAGVSNRNAAPDMVKSNVEEQVVKLSSRAEQRIGYFATIGNVSTLIGLMGTIYGLVLAFAAVGKPGVAAAVKTSMLASGISTAMNTTLFGLTIAVPCMLTYSYFRNTADKFIESFDRQAVGVLNAIYKQGTKLKNYKPSERRRSKEIDTDLDLTPIMGLMVVLIPLLLSSAEFVKMGVIEMNLPKSGRGRSGAVQPDEKPKNLNLGIIMTEKGISIKSALSVESDQVLDENGQPLPQIGLKGKDFDYKTLAVELSKIKRLVLKEVLSNFHSKEELESASLFQLSKFMESVDESQLFHYKDYETIKIVAKNDMEFQRIINVMDASRESLIGGRKVPLFPTVSMGAGI